MCENGLVLEEIRFHLKHLRRWMKERRVPTPLAQFHARSFVSPGAVWRGAHPLAVELSHPALLIAAGRGHFRGQLRRGQALGLRARHLRRHRQSAGEAFPPEYIAVVEGGRAQNSALLEQKFDYIFFTGSVAVGKVVMEAAAKHLTPVTLELGGKSPVIVDATANIQLAARRVAFGKVLNAGQTCVEPDYLFIHKSVQQPFVEAFRAALKEFFPHRRLCEHAPPSSPKSTTAASSACWRIRPSPSAAAMTTRARFIEPTLLADVSPDSPSCRRRFSAPSCRCCRMNPWMRSSPSCVPAPARWPSTSSRPIGKRSETAGQLLLRRRLHQRYHHPPRHLAHVLRRRGRFRHGRATTAKRASIPLPTSAAS